MKVCGIIVEYNPLHNGHIHHIEKARELTNCDVLIAVMSGNYVQRGELAIIDKWQRAKKAIENKVDLVIELPYNYILQSASQFAFGAISILKLLKVDSIVFGSECNNIENLMEIANVNINVNHLKENLKQGHSFVKSYSLLQGSYYPNDILGIAYLKALQSSNIIPYTIKRTTNYHDETISGNIASATSIRKAIFNNQDFINTTPMEFSYTNNNQDIFFLLKQLMNTLSLEYLKTIFLVSEGIETHILKCLNSTNNYDEFIDKAINRRYTKARIQRVCMHIINQVTKDEINNLPKLNYIRPLAFNTIGQKYLKVLKDDETLIIASDFSKIPKEYRQIEIKATYTYTYFISNLTIKNEVLTRELQGPIIIKD